MLSAQLEKFLKRIRQPWVTPFRVLMLLTAMFFLVYLDRGAIASNGVNGSEARIEKNTTAYDDHPMADGEESYVIDGTGFQGEFELTNLQNGILSSMFMFGMGIAIPIFSELIYDVNAFRLAGVSLLIWSVATFLCGLSFDFYSLACCRMFVGVGEAAIISLAPPYIDDTAPPKRKTFWLACLFLAVPLGYAAGYGYGGFVAKYWGWRYAFFIESIAMVPFVLFCFSAQPLQLNMHTEHGTEEMPRQEKRVRMFVRHVREILSHRVYVVTLAGYVCYIMFIGVVAYWGAKAAKAVYGMEDMVTASIAAGMGLSGTVLGGWALDRIGSTIPRALILCSFCCVVPGIFACLGFLLRPSLPIFICVYAVVLLLLFSLQAPVQATVLWCVPPNHRTLANGLSVLIVHLLGDVPGPPIFGQIVDDFEHRHGMAKDDAYNNALCIIAMVLFLAAFFFAQAAIISRQSRDYRQASGEEITEQRRLERSIHDDAPNVPLLQ